MTDATSEGLFAAGVAEILAKHIVDALPIPMFAVDNEHRVILWNVPCERLTGIPAGVIIGTAGAWSAFYPCEGPVMADRVLTGCRAEGLVRHYAEKYQPSALIANVWGFEDQRFSDNYIQESNKFARTPSVLGFEMDSIQDKRMISITQLNALLRLHPRPINVVVFHDPSGRVYLRMGLALRCFQRLSLPLIAAQRCS